VALMPTFDIDVAGLSIAAIGTGAPLPLVNGISFTAARGEITALIGESGSGKSLTASALLGLTDPLQYEVKFEHLRIADRSMARFVDADFAALRGRILGYVTQDPSTALDPTMTVGDQIAELFVYHDGMNWTAARKQAIHALDQVRISSAATRATEYPHAFSGGMKQRIVIAGAIALKPKILIADEPTSALDVTVQAEILALLDDLRRGLDMSVLLITHDLGIVYQIADQVLVMRGGSLVERGPAEVICTTPSHHYTTELLRAVPDLGGSPANGALRA
jgi:peptide/nickel transport system ATP-binding protein